MPYRHWGATSAEGICIAENTDVKVNIITNFADRKGLWRDGCILERLLCGWGHTVNRVQFNGREPTPEAGLNIFIETLRPDLFSLAGRNWWIPNPEWATPEDLAQLPSLDRVLCKTREAEALFAPLTDRAVYLGFESEDRYDPTVPRETKVLHIAGNSILKGTQAVLEAWEGYSLPYLLTVVGDEQVVKPRQIANVTYRLGRLEDEELRRLQNSHLIHLCPSETEGWGHTQHEGRSVNAVVVTTSPLMAGWWLNSCQYGSRCLAPLVRVGPADLAGAVRALLSPDFSGEPADLQWPEASEESPRAYFLRDREAFRKRFYALLPHPDHLISLEG